MDHRKGAVDVGVISEGRGLQLDCRTNGGHAVTVDLCENLVPEQIAGGFHNAAAEDHNIRTDRIDQVAGGNGQIVAGAVNGFLRDLVMIDKRLLEILAAEYAVLDLFRHHGFSAAGNLLPDVGGDSLLAGKCFEAASLSASAQRPFRIQNHMSVLGGLKAGAGKQASV